jgi:hypothetical protein
MDHIPQIWLVKDIHLRESMGTNPALGTKSSDIVPELDELSDLADASQHLSIIHRDSLP